MPSNPSQQQQQAANASKRAALIQQTAEALMACGGIMNIAAQKLGITGGALTHRVQKYPELQEARRNAEESVLDLAESRLIKGIQNDNMTAIIFTLKTKGKARGYVERQEITGPNGSPLEVNVSDLRKRVEGELDRLAAHNTTESISPKVH